MEISALDGYEIGEFEHNRKSKTVLRTGSCLLYTSDAADE